MKTVGPPYSGKLNVRWDEKRMIGRSTMAPSHSFTLDYLQLLHKTLNNSL